MKKKKKSGNTSDNGEIFPVDSLGIPILVDVVESAELPGMDEELGILAENSEAESEPLNPMPVSKKEHSTESPAEIHLNQITENIVDSVTVEIVAVIEPLIRDKVKLALRMYENELLQLPDEESEIKPG